MEMFMMAAIMSLLGVAVCAVPFAPPATRGERVEESRPVEQPALGPQRFFIERVIAHRVKRESKVVHGLLELGGTATLGDLVPVVYADTPVALHALAQYSLLAHLHKLVEERRVAQDGERWTWLAA